MKVVPLLPKEPPPELRDFWQDIHEEIESGDVCAVAVVRIGRDGSTQAGWAWDAGIDSARLIGGAAVLVHRLTEELDQ